MKILHRIFLGDFCMKKLLFLCLLSNMASCADATKNPGIWRNPFTPQSSQTREIPIDPQNPNSSTFKLNCSSTSFHVKPHQVNESGKIKTEHPSYMSENMKLSLLNPKILKSQKDLLVNYGCTTNTAAIICILATTNQSSDKIPVLIYDKNNRQKPKEIQYEENIEQAKKYILNKFGMWKEKVECPWYCACFQPDKE